MRALIVADQALLIAGVALDMMATLTEVGTHGPATARRQVIAVILLLVVAVKARPLRHESIRGQWIAVGFVLVAGGTVGSFVMRQLGAIAGRTIVAGGGMAGGAEVVAILVVGFVEAVIAAKSPENDAGTMQVATDGVEIGAAVRVVAGVAGDGKGWLRGEIVTDVAMGADIGADASRIVMTTCTELIGRSDQAGITSLIEMGGTEVMAGQAVEIQALVCPPTMSIAQPKGIHCRGEAAIELARLFTVMTSKAVSNMIAGPPGVFGGGNAGSVAMTTIAHAGVVQIPPINQLHASVAVPGVPPICHFRMTIRAVLQVDIGCDVAQVGAAGGWGAVAHGAALGIGSEAAVVGMTLGTVLIFVMGSCCGGTMEARSDMAGFTDGVVGSIEVFAIEDDRFTAHREPHQSGVGGLGVGVMAGSTTL